MPKNHHINRSHKPQGISAALNHRYFADKVETGSNGSCSDSPSGTHRWSIVPSVGESSSGRCRYCGTQREFWNMIDAALPQVGDIPKRKTR